MVNFIRGYSHEEDWQFQAKDFAKRMFEWRSKIGADDIANPELEDKLLGGPGGRSKFESMWQSGWIGEDSDGHPVCLDRVGCVPAEKFTANYDVEEGGLWERQSTFNKECVRLLCRHQSLKHRKRIYKTVAIIDLKGFGWSHTGSKMLDLVKKYNSLFAFFYPETLKNLYIINAPMVFSAGWSMVKPMLDPITAGKISVISRESALKDLVAERGLNLYDPDWRTSPISWKENLAEIRRLYNGQLPGCEPPAKDQETVFTSLGVNATATSGADDVAAPVALTKMSPAMGQRTSTQTPPGWEWWEGPKYPMDKGRLERRRQSLKLPFAKPFMLAWIVASTVRRQEIWAARQRRAVMVWQNRTLRALVGTRRSAVSTVEMLFTLIVVALAIGSSAMCWYIIGHTEHKVTT